MTVTAFDLAQRFVGVKEAVGTGANPMILGMLQLDAGTAITDDATPWCSGFANFIAWLLRLPRSKSLAARSWLAVGRPVPLSEARCGFDVVIFKRGQGQQPGPDVLNAPGHVAFFGAIETDANGRVFVQVIGGNQGDAVTLARFPLDQVLGVRRLA